MQWQWHALVNSLDLHIKHGGGVNVESPLFLEEEGQRLLLLELDVEPLGLQHEAWSGGSAQYVVTPPTQSPAAPRRRSLPPAA